METLTCSTGTWTGTGTINYTYQWQLDDADITGATASSYQLEHADEGGLITCVVTATDDYGPTSATAAAVGPVQPNNDLFTDLVTELFEETFLDIQPLFEIDEVTV
jgi:hypothetical protein